MHACYTPVYYISIFLVCNISVTYVYIKPVIHVLDYAKAINKRQYNNMHPCYAPVYYICMLLLGNKM